MGIETIRRKLRQRAARQRAGYRARESYRKQRKAWLRQQRARFALIAVAGGLVVLGFHLYFRAIDGNQTWLAGCLTGIFIGTFIGLRHTPPSRITTWEEGAWGEQLTAAELTKLPVDHWTVINDLRNSNWNFDHVAVSDQGIILVNSKWSTNRLESIDGKGIHLVNRYDESHTSIDKRVLPQARRDARDLQRQIRDRTGHLCVVQPVIAWWGQFPEASAMSNNVLVVQGKQLVDWLATYRGAPVPRQAIVEALSPGRRRMAATKSTEDANSA